MNKMMFSLVLLVGCASGPSEQQFNRSKFVIEPQVSSVQAEKYLHESVIPHVNFDGVDLMRVLNTLNEVTSHPPDYAPRIVLVDDGEIGKTKITFRREDASLLAVIDGVAEAADLKWWLDGDVFIAREEHVPAGLECTSSERRTSRRVQ